MEQNYLYPDATAVFSGNITGRADFYQRSTGVMVTVHVYGLPPENVAGFFALHIHEGANCEGERYSNTRGHYNPGNYSHPRHEGDLPPLLSNDGEAYMSVMTNRFGVDEIIGKTLVIHSDTDDFYSQPAGNPGIRIACGEIRRV